ncbi:MBL fold metallo-hydrolase, partial [Streptomyces sp. MCAF7]
PEEGMQAHVDLQGGEPDRGIMLPIHWGTFNLAPHPWEEPAEGTLTAARAADARVAIPRPGAPFEPEAGLPLDPWWRAIAARPAAGAVEAAAVSPQVPGRGAAAADGGPGDQADGPGAAVPLPQA